ncbi:SIS domain-containing protein [Candidatus Daviesbacteria bacterium]|nr:SIS domain-containing protein [Candidatus Daviesbacteria bacterium]
MIDKNYIQSILLEHIKVVLDINLQEIDELKTDFLQVLKRGGKILFFGNGGSATQASHWAEEFVGRFVKRRKPLPALALGTNFSNITGISNDFGFEEIFSREVEAFAYRRDLAVGISTSGNSPNVIKALETAKTLGIKTWIFTGNTKSKAKEIADKSLSINSDKTARIQELHALIIHIVFEFIEAEY